MKLWAARNEDCEFCILFTKEPYKVFDTFIGKYRWKTNDMCGTYMCLTWEMFPEVTFENSPQEVELKLIKKYD